MSSIHIFWSNSYCPQIEGRQTSKLPNMQPMTAHCHLSCINHLPSLSDQDLREACPPLISRSRCSTKERFVFLSGSSCIHTGMYTASAHAQSWAICSHLETSVTQPQGLRPLLPHYPAQALRWDLQTSPKFQWVDEMKTLWIIHKAAATTTYSNVPYRPLAVTGSSLASPQQASNRNKKALLGKWPWKWGNTCPRQVRWKGGRFFTRLGFFPNYTETIGERVEERLVHKLGLHSGKH